ncbi:hypothetical protein REPUB_Repub01dG0069500 [Reevesia pubescens]
MHGRPKRLRHKEVGETSGHTLSRRGRKMRCKKCFHLGHNSRKYPNTKNQNVSNILSKVVKFHMVEIMLRV